LTENNTFISKEFIFITLNKKCAHMYALKQVNKVDFFIANIENTNFMFFINFAYDFVYIEEEKFILNRSS